MSKIQDYKRMKVDLNSIMEKVVSLKEERQKIDREFEPKSDAVLRYEIMDDSRFTKAKQDLEKLRVRRTQIKDELERAERKTKLTAQILSERKVAATAEINKQNSKKFWEKAQVFAKKLQEAQILELELVELRKKARRDLVGIDANEDRCEIPAWPEVVISNSSTGKKDGYGSFTEFMKSNSKDHIELG